MNRPTSNKNVITSKWVFKVKYTQIDHINRYKTRLIIRKFSQVQGIDFEKIFSPTLKFELFQMLLVFFAHFKYEIKQMNVPNAYLKKKVKEIIYMEISEGYEPAINQQINQSDKKKRDRILRLFRPLYDLKQSARK